MVEINVYGKQRVLCWMFASAVHDTQCSISFITNLSVSGSAEFTAKMYGWLFKDAVHN